MRYAVAIISFYDNENKIHVVEADGEIEAMKTAILSLSSEEDRNYAEDTLSGCNTIEEIKQHMFDGDQAISSPLKIMIL